MDNLLDNVLYQDAIGQLESAASAMNLTQIF